MTIPDYESLMRPTLAAIADGEPHSRSDIRQTVASALNVPAEDLLVMLPSGKTGMFASRVGWALTYMTQAGLTTRARRGVYVISDRGRRVLDAHPERVDNSVLEQFTEFVDFRSRRNEREPVLVAVESAERRPLSPAEAVDRLVTDADAATAADLLDRVLGQPPDFLERLALRLLRSMGYGGPQAQIQHTGRPGDRGLDGIVRQDPLGLDLVGVQAKRYDRDAAVQRPEMQAFVGALQGAQTSRGVFVTTGRFSTGAREFAEQVPVRLVLIDGAELTRLMVKHDVGVIVRETYAIKEVDEGLFDE